MRRECFIEIRLALAIFAGCASSPTAAPAISAPPISDRSSPRIDAPPRARATPAEAPRASCEGGDPVELAARGEAAFKRADWVAAAAAFECAYVLDPKPKHLFNLGASYEKAEGTCVRAAASFRRFIDACGACAERGAGELRLWKLEATCPEAILVEADGLILPITTVDVEGWGAIRGGDEAGARREASRDAQRQALEAAAGVHIRSFMSDQSGSDLRDGSEKLFQEVRSKIETASEGFIQKVEVVREWREGQTFKIAARVHVENKTLLREIALMARGLRWARFPKVMFLVAEEYTDRAGKTTAVAEPTLQAVLESEFLARGFDLVDAQQIQRLRSEEAAVFSDIVTDENKAAKLAMQHGAEYVITGVARVRHTSFDDLNLKEHHGFAELSVRGIDASTAAVVTSVKESGNGPANCFSEPDLRIRTVTANSPKLGKALLANITRWWDGLTKNGVPYSVKLFGIKSYKTDGLAFIELLRKVPGMKDVKERSYGGERMEIDLRYTAAYGPEQLNKEILRIAGGDKRLSSIDLEYINGHDLSFRLGGPR